ANDATAIELGNACVRKLIALQGPNGEWPWFFDAPNGAVLDFYEVYSVHQYGMAPAFLQQAEFYGVLDARAAMIKGFYWVLGKNQMGVPMLMPDQHLTIRSQVRKGEQHSNGWRALRALKNSVFHSRASFVDPNSLELRLECRSYELGWILWSFGQRSDLSELTHHKHFTDVVGASDNR